MSKKIYIGNLTSSVTEKDLHSLFSPLGTIISLKISMKAAGNFSAGHAYVIMSNDTETQAAIAKLNGTKLGGASIVVMEAHPIDQDDSYKLAWRPKRKVRR